MSIAMIGICVPTFLMGPLLVLIFGINLEVLPVSGWDQLPGCALKNKGCDYQVSDFD